MAISCPVCGGSYETSRACVHCGYAPPPPPPPAPLQAASHTVTAVPPPAGAPAATALPQAPAEPPAPRPAGKRLVALALLVLGLLGWSHEGPLGSVLLFVPTVVLVAVLIGDTFAFGWFRRVQERTPRLPWARLYPIAVWGLVVIALLRSGAFYGFFIFGAGLVMLMRQRSTALGPLDASHVWSTWGRRVMLFALLFAAITLASQWDADFSSSYTTTSGDWEYTYSTNMPSRNAYETGDAFWLAPLVALSFLALAWRPANPPHWYRFAPLIPGVLAGIVALNMAVSDNAEVQELYEIGGTYAKFNADGPVWFLIGMIVYCIAGAVVALRGRRLPATAAESLPS